MKLNRKPVNSLSLEFFNELIANLDQIEQDDTIQGVILTSVFLKRASHYVSQ